MKLTILGSGSPEAHIRRASSGYLLEAGDDRILFDCGGGVFDNLLRGGFRPSDVTHLVFSHLHSDHMMDYARLIHAIWDEGGALPKVFGPAPLAEITEKLFGRDGVFAHDLTARTEFFGSRNVWIARGGTLPRPWPDLAVQEIDPGFGMDGKGWSLSSCEVPHVQPHMTCMGFAVEEAGRRFVYSGDAGPCEALTALFRKADLLLHWCYRLGEEPVDDAMAALTPAPADIARMARAANVKRLLLTHFRRHMDEEPRHRAALDDLARHFGAGASIAEDLQSFTI